MKHSTNDFFSGILTFCYSDSCTQAVTSLLSRFVFCMIDKSTDLMLTLSCPAFLRLGLSPVTTQVQFVNLTFLAWPFIKLLHLLSIPIANGHYILAALHSSLYPILTITLANHNIR